MSVPSTSRTRTLLGSAVPAPNATPFEEEDVRRLEGAAWYAEYAASAGVAALLPSGASASTAAAVRQCCTFAHCGLLLFPLALDAGLQHFADSGLDPLSPVPSVLVRRRLSDRYGLANEACEVSVTRLRTSERVDNRLLEVFLFPRTAKALEPRIVDAERKFGFENHIALHVVQPDEQLLERLMVLLQRDAGLVWEGGGHNPHEGARGSTVLYFVNDRSVNSTRHPFERWEVHCRGDFASLIDRHPVDPVAVARAYSTWTDTDRRCSAQCGEQRVRAQV